MIVLDDLHLDFLELVLQILSLLDNSVILPTHLFLGFLIEGFGFGGFYLFPMPLNFFLLFLFFEAKLKLYISLLKDITQHQLLIE